MDGPYCEHCGQPKQPLPSRGFGNPAVGCPDLSCPGVHPYFVAQEVAKTRGAVDRFAEAVERLRAVVEAGPGLA